ncbi:hypothetical protein CERZMDRAFT_96041 [Cercospora zeae-maydis SCOH1-5]|uniref:Protein kinase domain-containing protein n=1 Tax=Cercospora zeae-maydis SCOH1-5 TaxID=717836 RepID=A0A6A6FKQ1_9PEZI|nr:hypothetical protein CERZMDRAFT_96041 [Cercospora zeae-maydis SCOH1-5]
MQEELREKLGEAFIITIERTAIGVYAGFDPEELIMPPPLDDDDSAAESMELMKFFVKVERTKFDIAKWNESAEDIGFGGSLPGTWIYKGELGAGDYGIATLWVQLDDHARFSNREGLKNTYLQSNRDDASYWSGNIADRRPLKCEVVQHLNALDGADNIVRYLSKSDTERLSHRAGTTGWMAPEVNEGASEEHSGPSEASDIWSLGRVMLALATFKGPLGQPLKTKRRGEDEVLLYQLAKYQPWGR